MTLSLLPELRKECREIAERTMRVHCTGDILHDLRALDAQEQVAREYFSSACSELVVASSYRAPYNDPNILLRAVRFLKSQAVGAMESDTEWFRKGLSVLMLIACAAGGSGDQPFFEDLKRGILGSSKSRATAKSQ